MKIKNNQDEKSFDREQAIQGWRKNLRRMGALQDGDFVELEGYLHDKIEEFLEQGLDEEAAFQKAAAEFTDISELDGDYYRARNDRISASRHDHRCLDPGAFGFFNPVHCSGNGVLQGHTVGGGQSGRLHQV